jgi:hypothetical protein
MVLYDSKRGDEDEEVTEIEDAGELSYGDERLFDWLRSNSSQENEIGCEQSES